nr:MAG TPA: minor capsid protein [Caudoviricetes sp.]
MTQGEIEQLTVKTENIFSELEIRIMSDIVRRIKENGVSTASADWQISRLQQLGMSEKQIRTWIQKALEASDKEMDHIFSDEAYREYYGHARAYKLADLQQIPFEQNTFLQQLLEVTKQRLESEYRNIAGSMGFAIRDPATGKIRSAPLMEYYRSTLDNAVMDIHSGAFDYNTVLRRTINQMTASGIRYIEYDSGHRDRVNVAVRRAVLTGFRQVQGKLNEQVAADLNTDQYEVSYHVGARPTHQSWQGKVWSMQQLKEVCGLGEITGLCGINCYHTYRVFSPGSVRTYTDKQLAEMVKEENTPKEYNGKQYATYEALQQQRKMERGMRAQRQRIKLLEEGGADEQEIILAKAKYQGQMQTYKDFSEKMGLPEQKARIMQDGLRGRFMPTKSEQKFLEESVINDKIKADMKAAGLRGEINLKPQIPDVSKLSFDEHHVNQERQHNVTEAEAKSYIQNAVFSTTKWKGKFTNYYSDEGAAFVDNEAQHIKTAFKKEQYDKAATAAMEVLKRGRS